MKSQNERFPADIDDIAGRFRTRFSLSLSLLVSSPALNIGLYPHLMLLSHSIAVPTIHKVRDHHSNEFRTETGYTPVDYAELKSSLQQQ